jgi:hypothetical protein
MEDVPQLQIIYPVPMDHPAYPTVLDGAEASSTKVSSIVNFFKEINLQNLRAYLV